MNKQILSTVLFLCFCVVIGAQESPPPPTPAMIANKLLDAGLSIEAKDKLLDIAIAHKFKFNKEEAEKLKEFITQGLLSPYLSDKFKEKFIGCIAELEILLFSADDLCSDTQILLSLSPGNRRKLILNIYDQGLYDEKFQERLMSLLKSEKFPKGEKLLALAGLQVCLFPTLPSNDLNQIRTNSKTYAELTKAVEKISRDKTEDDDWADWKKARALAYKLVMEDDDGLFVVNSQIENENWYAFVVIVDVAVSTLDSNLGKDPIVLLAEKRLEVFYKKNRTEKDYASNYEYNKAYLKSLLAEPGGVVMLNELMFIRPEKIYMFKVFFGKNQRMDICELAKDVLNKYHKGKPFFWDYRDYFPYLEGLNPKSK
jgi:hypothetical protein